MTWVAIPVVFVRSPIAFAVAFMVAVLLGLTLPVAMLPVTFSATVGLTVLRRLLTSTTRRGPAVLGDLAFALSQPFL